MCELQVLQSPIPRYFESSDNLKRSVRHVERIVFLTWMLPLVKQISGMLQSIKTDRKVSDRRRAPRVGFRARIEMITSPAAPASASVWIRNISLGGVGLLHNRKLAVGETIVLCFPNGLEKPLSVPCEIAHCGAIPN